MEFMTTSEVRPSADDRLSLDQLQANAARCRELAEAATDPEVKLALTQLARDIDTAISVIEQNAREPDARN
jgi:hypothetical protein